MGRRLRRQAAPNRAAMPTGGAMTTQWQWWCAGVAGGIDAMSRFMHAMLGGMLVLVLPSFFVCLGIAIMAYQKRNQYREQ